MTLRPASKVQYYPKQDEPNDCGNLDNSKDEFCFAIALDTEQVDGDDEEQEDGYPGIVVDMSMVPILDRQSGRYNLER